MADTAQHFARLVAALGVDTAALLPVADALQQRITHSAGDAHQHGGIPLLALKNDALLSYLHHLVLLTAHRLRGNSLSSQPGSQLVENLVRLRLVLEKARPLESKMRYQIDKAVKAAELEERGGLVKQSGKGKGRTQEEDDGSDEDDDDDDDDEDDDDEEVDPLAFRPNPAALMAASKQTGASSGSKNAAAAAAKKPQRRTGTSAAAAAAADHNDDDDDEDAGEGVYRPPKLAPVPYDPDSVSRRRSGDPDDRRLPPAKRNAALLADLSLGLSSNPYELSSAGLGGAGRNSASSAQASARAKALRRMEEYEEDNFTRLVMKKKDAKRRRRDEEAVALGGAGLDSANRRQGRLGAGLDEEFGDLLRGSGGAGARRGKKRAGGGGGDAYEALRGSAAKRVKVSSGTLSGSSAGPSSAKELFRSGGGRAAKSQFSKDVARSRQKARK